MFFALSKEDPHLAAAEAEGLIRAWQGRVIETTERHVIADAGESMVEDRAVLTRQLCELLAESRADSLVAAVAALKIVVPTGQTFMVRAHGLDQPGSAALEYALGQAVSGKARLTAPDIVFDAFVEADGGAFFCKRLFEYDPKWFRGRDVRERPFFHPTSLKPKSARILLNLAGLRRGESVLDPFCGVAGILIEAGALGLKGTGVEMDQLMQLRAIGNLEHYRLADRFTILFADFLAVPLPAAGFDAIVTDLPYGKSSLLFGKKLEELYLAAFQKAAVLLKPQARFVVMGPSDLSKLLEQSGFAVELKTTSRAHKSLNRWTHVCVRA